MLSKQFFLFCWSISICNTTPAPAADSDHITTIRMPRGPNLGQLTGEFRARRANLQNGDPAAQYYRLTGQRGKRQRAKTLSLPSPRQVTWLLLDGARTAEAKTKAWVERLRQQVPDIDLVAQLAREFGLLLREQRSSGLAAWIEQVAQSSLASFVAGLRRDFSALRAAFSLPWSQGQVEGQVKRLKMLKRQMYGRAGFPLLRSRMLFTTSPSREVAPEAA